MSRTAGEILAAFREGTLSAEEAARQLLPLLQTSGKLNLELGPDVRPVLEALRQLTAAGAPAAKAPAEPLAWESPHWRSLPRVAENFWTIIKDRRLQDTPHCLRYAFTVRTAQAAEALQDWIEDHADHQVTTDLPASFQLAAGLVVGETPPKILTRADLTAWVAWLQSVPPVADAALSDLGINAPPVP
jgi:hypothetical protein